jgi:nucleoside 2-deoxyribosyltransferase
MKIYLSGGMYSGWQDLISHKEGVEYFDPRLHSQQNISAIKFVEDDIKAVKESDLVFCYIEESNPMPLGAAWECAVASESNIPIITVWEKSYIDPFFATNSLYLYRDFNSGLERLNKQIERMMK